MYWQSECKTACLWHGKVLEVLKTFPDCCVDSVVADPPYGLSFMGKKWDYHVPTVEEWEQVLRVLKPGGHLLCFSGTRTQHRMAVNIEDAGFEIRDMIAWVYGSGFPKSLDISKAIDKAAGAQREKVPATGGLHKNSNLNDDGWCKIGAESPLMDSTVPVSNKAKQWQGWGTALKPALEPITVARKPFAGTVAANVLLHGTAGLNIDASRIAINPDVDGSRLGGNGSWGTENAAKNVYEGGYAGERVESSPLGRWPANFIHDGSEEVVGLFPVTKSSGNPNRFQKMSGGWKSQPYGNQVATSPTDSGSAARFFYCAKASKSDRGEGNNHPTVKPEKLMQYLVRLVTPPNGIVLDPWTGSGSTGKAAEGFIFWGIDMELEYVELAKNRISQRLKPSVMPELPEPPFELSRN